METLKRNWSERGPLRARKKAGNNSHLASGGRGDAAARGGLSRNGCSFPILSNSLSFFVPCSFIGNKLDPPFAIGTSIAVGTLRAEWSQPPGLVKIHCIQQPCDLSWNLLVGKHHLASPSLEANFKNKIWGCCMQCISTNSEGCYHSG